MGEFLCFLYFSIYFNMYRVATSFQDLASGVTERADAWTLPLGDSQSGGGKEAFSGIYDMSYMQRQDVQSFLGTEEGVADWWSKIFKMNIDSMSIPVDKSSKCSRPLIPDKIKDKRQASPSSWIRPPWDPSCQALGWSSREVGVKGSYTRAWLSKIKKNQSSPSSFKVIFNYLPPLGNLPMLLFSSREMGWLLLWGPTTLVHTPPRVEQWSPCVIVVWMDASLSSNSELLQGELFQAPGERWTKDRQVPFRKTSSLMGEVVIYGTIT